MLLSASSPPTVPSPHSETVAMQPPAMPPPAIQYEVAREVAHVPASPAIGPFVVPAFDLSAMFESQAASARLAIEEEDVYYRYQRAELQQQVDAVQERMDALQQHMNTLKQQLAVVDREHEVKRSRLSNKMTQAAEALRKEMEQAMAKQWAALVASLPK
jgi:hypothetical protein